MSFLVLFFGIINLVRIALLLIGSDLYSLSHHINKRKGTQKNLKSVTVVIPAHNEEKTICDAVMSVHESDYQKDRLQIIVVDDGSTDGTYEKLIKFKERNYIKNLEIVRLQKNNGKAYALNTAMKEYACGEIVMCLDADSVFSKSAIKNAVFYFQDEKVMAVGSNVKVKRSKGILNLVQVFEYVICYQMKRAQSYYNIEYIIGGIGSSFRNSFLKEISFYDGNTVTEDIDLTMKILKDGNKNARVVYGADVVTFTQGAQTLSDLIKQRYRWKWGRYQTFLKNTEMFFSKDEKFTKGFSWVHLPYAIWGDVAFLFEPFILTFIVGIAIFYHDLFTIISAWFVITFYVVMNILAEDTIHHKKKIKLLFLSPFMYVLFYVLSFVEYVVLIKALLNIHKLRGSLNKRYNTWTPIKRLSFSSSS